MEFAIPVSCHEKRESALSLSPFRLTHPRGRRSTSWESCKWSAHTYNPAAHHEVRHPFYHRFCPSQAPSSMPCPSLSSGRLEPVLVDCQPTVDKRWWCPLRGPTGGTGALVELWRVHRVPLSNGVDWRTGRSTPLVDQPRENSSHYGPTFSALRQCLGEPLINGITGYSRDATNSALSIYADPSKFPTPTASYVRPPRIYFISRFKPSFDPILPYTIVLSYISYIFTLRIFTYSSDISTEFIRWYDAVAWRKVWTGLKQRRYEFSRLPLKIQIPRLCIITNRTVRNNRCRCKHIRIKWPFTRKREEAATLIRGHSCPSLYAETIPRSRSRIVGARSEVGRSTVTTRCTIRAYANRLDFVQMAFLFVVKNGACEPRFPCWPTFAGRCAILFASQPAGFIFFRT